MWTQPIAALVCVAAQAPASELPPFAAPGELAEWVTGYYTAPQPEYLGAALAMTLEHYEDFGTGAQPLMVGLALAAAQHPESLREWCGSLEQQQNGQWFAAVVAWWTDSPQGRAIVQDIAARADDPSIYQQLIDRPTTDLKAAPIQAPLVQDMLWVCFFMTGDTDYVARFVPLLPKPPEGDQTPGWQQRLMLHGSARWSFTANAYQHPRVLDFARAHHDTTEDVREQAALAEIIQSVEQRIEDHGPPPPLRPGPTPAPSSPGSNPDADP